MLRSSVRSASRFALESVFELVLRNVSCFVSKSASEMIGGNVKGDVGGICVLFVLEVEEEVEFWHESGSG